MTDRNERLLQEFLDDLGSAPVPTGLSRRVSRRIQDDHPARASRFGAWFMPVAAALAIVGLAGIALVVGGPKPSPSGLPVPASASESASPSAWPSSSASASAPAPATPAPSSTLVPPPTGLPDPSAAPSPSASAAVFHVTLDPNGNPLLVQVGDASSSVTAAAEARHNLPTDNPVEVVQGSAPDKVIVGWIGGACDLLSKVTLDAARKTVSVSTLTTNQGCDAIGIERAVVLTFGQPVVASSIKGQWGSPLSPGTVALSPTAVSFTDANHGFLAGSDAPTGLAYLAETSNSGTSWTRTPIGWGTVTGLGVTVDATISAYPMVAISCTVGAETADPGCVPGIYQGPGARWGRMSEVDPVALAARDGAVAALIRGALPSNGGTAPFPPRKVALSADGGTTWTTIPSPCPDLEATGIALDASHRPLVVCEGGGAGGGARKQLWRGSDAKAMTWSRLSDPPEPGTGFALSLAADGTGVMWGPRSPLLVTADGGSTWTPNAIADGDVRIVEGGSALPGGKALILVWDPDRGRTLLLRTTNAGATWTELVAFPAPG